MKNNRIRKIYFFPDVFLMTCVLFGGGGEGEADFAS
jgi:hypothetical protein